MNQGRPTMRDVAAMADVSFKTVSRVVNGEPGVRDEVVVRVRNAIDQLGYQPDHRARGLRSKDPVPGLVGLVLRDISNPFFANVFRGVEQAASKIGGFVLAGSTDGSPEQENRLVGSFVGRRVSGMIVVSSGSSGSTLTLELERGTPIVFIDAEPDIESIDLVRSDHFAGARVLTEHLLEHGHTDIAYFGDHPHAFSARLRIDGFRAAMESRGITVPKHRVVTADLRSTDWRQTVTEHIDGEDPPSAIVGGQNVVTIGAARALHDLGLQRAIAQVGFDDLELADLVEPGLTVVSQNPRELGRRAAEQLFARLDGDRSPPRRQVVPVVLIKRGSGEIRPQPR